MRGCIITTNLLLPLSCFHKVKCPTAAGLKRSVASTTPPMNRVLYARCLVTVDGIHLDKMDSTCGTCVWNRMVCWLGYSAETIII